MKRSKLKLCGVEMKRVKPESVLESVVVSQAACVLPGRAPEQVTSNVERIAKPAVINQEVSSCLNCRFRLELLSSQTEPDF
jgi:hypothetical protein